MPRENITQTVDTIICGKDTFTKNPTRIAPSEGHGIPILTVEDQLSPQGIIQGFGVSDTGGFQYSCLGI